MQSKLDFAKTQNDEKLKTLKTMKDDKSSPFFKNTKVLS